MTYAFYYLIECDDATHVAHCSRALRDSDMTRDDYRTFAHSFDYIDDVLRHAHAHNERHNVTLHIHAIHALSRRIHTITRNHAHDTTRNDAR